jgi:hypothetical protein
VTFRDELGGTRCRDDAWLAAATAGGAITVPAIPPAVGADVALEKFAVGGAGKGDEGLATLRTRLLVDGQFHFVEDDGQMAVVAAWRTGSAALLAAGAWRFGGRENGSLVRRVGRGGFRLAAKELAFAQAELGAQVFEFGLEFREAGAGPLMHALPVTGLLAEFEIVGVQRARVAAWR